MCAYGDIVHVEPRALQVGDAVRLAHGSDHPWRRNSRATRMHQGVGADMRRRKSKRHISSKPGARVNYERAEAIRRCLAAMDKMANLAPPSEIPCLLAARSTLRRELVRIEARAA
jgi:hypothetical protein